MIPFKLRLWWAKRKGYTPAMAEHYAVIAEYDWYDVKFFTEALAITPLLLLSTMLFYTLAKLTYSPRKLLSEELLNGQTPLAARKQ